MNQLPRIRFLAMIGLMALLGCAGEGTKRPPLGKVKGTVTYNGSPVSGASVAFTMERAPRAASGITDDSGNFQLTTYNTNDGAFVGTHKVTVAKIALAAGGKDPKTLTADDLLKNPPAPALTTGLIPEKYSDPKTSPLTNTVNAGENNLKIELTD